LSLSIKVCGNIVDNWIRRGRLAHKLNEDDAVKIDDSIKKAPGLGVGTTQTRSNKSTEKAGTSQPASDNVRLSPQVQALAGQVASAGVFDSSKVEEIKAAIAGGQFQVDPEKVANGLLDTVNDLIRSRKA
jgi:negative regulator of flagellin synthesis FlgM